MRQLLIATCLLCACAHTEPAPVEASTAQPLEAADAGTLSEKLREAKILGKKAADYPMPVPNTRTQVIEEFLHGTKVSDPFRWLEDEKAPEVVEWMKQQDKFARDAIHALKGRDALLARYKELYYLEAVSAPIKRGGRYFFTRTHKDKEKAITY